MNAPGQGEEWTLNKYFGRMDHETQSTVVKVKQTDKNMKQF